MVLYSEDNVWLKDEKYALGGVPRIVTIEMLQNHVNTYYQLLSFYDQVKNCFRILLLPDVNHKYIIMLLKIKDS